MEIKSLTFFMIHSHENLCQESKWVKTSFRKISNREHKLYTQLDRKEIPLNGIWGERVNKNASNQIVNYSLIFIGMRR